MVEPRNLKVIGVEDDGERTVVDQVDLHIGAKDTVRHMLNVLSDECQKILVKFVSDIGRAGVRKRRTAAVAAYRGLHTGGRLSAVFPTDRWGLPPCGACRGRDRYRPCRSDGRQSGDPGER